MKNHLKQLAKDELNAEDYIIEAAFDSIAAQVKPGLLKEIKRFGKLRYEQGKNEKRRQSKS